MTATLVSNDDLDTLEKLARESFKDVKKNDTVVLPNLAEPKAYTSENMGHLYRIESVKNSTNLEIVFILDNYEDKFWTKPLNYFSHLLGHEGKNSILSYLMEKNYALSLGTYCDHNLHAFTSMHISIELTQNGKEHYEDVIEAVFF